MKKIIILLQIIVGSFSLIAQESGWQNSNGMLINKYYIPGINQIRLSDDNSHIYTCAGNIVTKWDNATGKILKQWILKDSVTDVNPKYELATFSKFDNSYIPLAEKIYINLIDLNDSSKNKRVLDNITICENSPFHCYYEAATTFFSDDYENVYCPSYFQATTSYMPEYRTFGEILVLIIKDSLKQRINYLGRLITSTDLKNNFVAYSANRSMLSFTSGTPKTYDDYYNRISKANYEYYIKDYNGKKLDDLGVTIKKLVSSPEGSLICGFYYNNLTFWNDTGNFVQNFPLPVSDQHNNFALNEILFQNSKEMILSFSKTTSNQTNDTIQIQNYLIKLNVEKLIYTDTVAYNSTFKIKGNQLGTPVVYSNLRIKDNRLVFYGSDGYLRKIDTLKVSDIQEEYVSQFSLYPNPASDFIEISGCIDDSWARHALPLQESIRIYNVMGECVMNVGVQNFEPLHVDVSALSPGLYFLRTGAKAVKFIKN